MTDERLRELYQHAIAARDDGGRAQCPAPERLLAVARREGSEEERLRTLDHAMSCSHCVRELELLRAIEKAGTRISGAGAAARSEPSRSWRRAVPLALAASAVLAVSLVVRGRDDDRVTGDPMRSGDSAAIALHTPRDVELRSDDSLVVAWQPVSGATRFVVEVLDADGRAVLADTTSDTTHVVRNLGALAPERDYRWWVRELAVGRPQRSSPLFRLRITTP
jgi:hypothetical protein